ncbi:WD repeat-containing protein 7-like isoform X1 [Clavelina lepadiformis]|uniref:WD repeat-containing protein 7-like isoform X1 n=2 Tax=Clavelina lepadiformis TaxID=159417 RepID=UPI0040417BDA
MPIYLFTLWCCDLLIIYLHFAIYFSEIFYFCSITCMANSLVVPLVLWGHNPPTHRICSILFTPDFKTIVSGCRDGQLCVWEYDGNTISPKFMLFGHTGPVTSLTAVPSGTSGVWKKHHIISVSDTGEVCLWDLVDGRCLEQTKLLGSPTEVVGHNFVINDKPQQCVMCYGQFSEIIILSASTLTVVLSLASRIFPDWLACATIVPCSQSSDACSVIGLTISGMLKLWRIPKSYSQPGLFEEESKQVSCLSAVCMRIYNENSHLLLIVCSSTWHICDADDYSFLGSVNAEVGFQFLGGDFLSCNVVAVWGRNGEVLLYKLPFCAANQENYRSNLKNKSHFLPKHLQKISLVKTQQFLLPPAASINQTLDDSHTIHILMGTCEGEVAVGQLTKEGNRTAVLKCSLQDLWNSLDRKPIGIIDQLSPDPNEPINVTTSLFVVQYCYLCCGREDGSIIIVPAAKTCKTHLFLDECSNRKGLLPHRTLRGHRDRVTCLLYPFQEEPQRFSPQILLSGGADFAVIIWDIILGTLLHSFHIHGGEISQLLIPPEGCNQRVNHSICSVASDHSVGLLNLKDRKRVLLASRHPSPINAIHWRPDDDFLIVSCADSFVFVWQMETGNLDRCEQGAVAADILSACDEMEAIRSEPITPSSLDIAQAFKLRSLSAFKAVAQQGLKSLIEGLESDKRSVEMNDQFSAANVYRAMIISPLRASPVHDTDSHIIFFNTEALIAKLLMEHTQKRKHRTRTGNRADMSPSSGSRKTAMTSFERQVKHQFLDDGSDSSAVEGQVTKTRRDKKQISPLEVDSAIDIAQIIVSCIHAWDLDSNIDEFCRERLGLLTPRSHVSFGLLSHYGHMALLFPKASAKGIETSAYSNDVHWQISSSLTTQHLVSIISIANTMMELPFACFRQPSTALQSQRETTDSDEISKDQLSTLKQSQVKQSWSLLATLHCVLLPERMEMLNYKPAKLELLARRWQDRCLELREASQALMLAELRQMGSDGRRKVVELWSRHVPDYVDPQGNDVEQLDSPASYMVADEVGDQSSICSDDLVTGTHSSTKVSFEVRRRHATAIVILGVIGAEFGQELEPRQAQRINSDIPEGFGIMDYSLARHTCKALVYLLLQPASPRLPANVPIRRAAIDLLGRGFTVWEPYMEVSAVLLGLLELCENYSKYISSIQSGLPLTPEADSCRSAHHSLSLIATARPLTFITTIAREVARHNAAAANPQHQALLARSVLVRAKPEILRIVELLADKMVVDMNNVLVEVVDIVLFCIDVTVLRASYGLLEAVPALTKFHTISYDARSRRVAVAASTGSIVLYDIRTCKHQVVPRGLSRITALCFSPDGKYLCVYCESENQLSFWITATSLFGMIQSQVKCVKTINPLKVHPKVQSNGNFHSSYKFGNLAKLVWVNNRVVVLLTSDGAEFRFHI